LSKLAYVVAMISRSNVQTLEEIIIQCPKQQQTFSTLVNQIKETHTYTVRMTHNTFFS
jgi:hypothetical protein